MRREKAEKAFSTKSLFDKKVDCARFCVVFLPVKSTFAYCRKRDFRKGNIFPLHPRVFSTMALVLEAQVVAGIQIQIE